MGGRAGCATGGSVTAGEAVLLPQLPFGFGETLAEGAAGKDPVHVLADRLGGIAVELDAERAAVRSID